MSDRVLAASVFLFTCVVLVVHTQLLGDWMLDDAFIFFRYAQNWAAGEGLVFNAGGERVEGFTSFLWLASLTLGRLCGADLVIVAMVLGQASLIATLVLVHQSYRWLEEIDVVTASLAALLLGTTAAFTTWGRSGMETAFHALLVTGLVISYLRAKERGPGVARFAGIGLLCTLVGMNRPDGLLVVAVLAVDAMISRRCVSWRSVIVTAVAFLTTFGTYFAWRYSYFGYLFPNTFYAKVGSSGAQVMRGLEYLMDSAFVFAPLLLMLLMVGRGWFKVNVRYVVVPVLLTIYTLYIALVGGDVMPAQRFFVPVLPWLCLLVAMAVRVFSPAVRWCGVLLAVGFGLTLMFTMSLSSIASDVVAHNGRVAGLWLRKNAPPGSVVATNTAGTIPYYSGLTTIDTLGLNDLHIAHVEIDGMGGGHAGHEKGDGDYVLGKKPEFIQLGSSLGWTPSKGNLLPPFLGDRQLWKNPKFTTGYTLLPREGKTLWPGGRKCGWFGFYVRNDLYDLMQTRK